MTPTLFARALHNDACPLWVVKLLAWLDRNDEPAPVAPAPTLMEVCQRHAGRELTAMEASAVEYLALSLEAKQ